MLGLAHWKDSHTEEVGDRGENVADDSLRMGKEGNDAPDIVS